MGGKKEAAIRCATGYERMRRRLRRPDFQTKVAAKKVCDDEGVVTCEFGNDAEFIIDEGKE